MSDARLRLAVAQPPGELDTPDARLGWLRDALPEVAARGAHMLLLPELFACGYNIGARVAERAEPAGGPTAQAVAELTRAHGVAVHYGFAERADGRLYNAALCIGPGGERLGHHRKLVIPPGFERDHFSPGRGCRLFGFRGFRIATLICYDAEFSETARHVAAQGADVILVPTALRDVWEWVARAMIPTRAYENGVYLGYANGAGVDNGMAYLGQSVIAAPDGTEAARAGAGPEILYADLDKATIAAARARLPYLDDRGLLKL